MKKMLVLIGLAATSLSSSRATILLQDNFSTNGGLVWTAPSAGGIWQSLSGADGTLLVSGGRLQIQDDNTEDSSSAFPTIQSLELFVGFTLNMSDLDTPSTNGEFFASFRSGGSYDGRILALRPPGTPTGKFRLGISNTGESATVWGSDLNTGVDYRVVVQFTQAGSNDLVTLWVGPFSAGSPSVSTAPAAINTSLSAFAFRQDRTTGDMAIDDLIVATTFAEAIPEPKLLFLTGASLVLGFRRRRRFW